MSRKLMSACLVLVAFVWWVSRGGVSASLYPAMVVHTLSAQEVGVDTTAPGKLRSLRGVVTRGKTLPPGVSQPGSGLGTISLDLTPSIDDRTPADQLGYRVRVIRGCVPAGFIPPDKDYRALTNNNKAHYLLFTWPDVPPSPPEPLRFWLAVSAVDLAGNVGPETVVELRDPSTMPIRWGTLDWWSGDDYGGNHYSKPLMSTDFNRCLRVSPNDEMRSLQIAGAGEVPFRLAIYDNGSCSRDDDWGLVSVPQSNGLVYLPRVGRQGPEKVNPPGSYQFHHVNGLPGKVSAMRLE